MVRITETDQERDGTVPEVVSGTIGARGAPKPMFAEGSASLPVDRLAPIIADAEPDGGATSDSTKVPTRPLPRMQFKPPPPVPSVPPVRERTSPIATPVAVTLVRPLVARREPTPQPLPPPARAPIRWDIALVAATIMALVLAGVVALVR